MTSSTTSPGTPQPDHVHRWRVGEPNGQSTVDGYCLGCGEERGGFVVGFREGPDRSAANISTDRHRPITSKRRWVDGIAARNR